MKKKDLTDIKDVLKNAVNENFYKFGFKILLLKEYWSDIVGEQLSLYTSPEILRFKTLVVYCIHQGWVNTLQFHKTEILNAIKNKFENYLQVENITFKFGKPQKNEFNPYKNNISSEIKPVISGKIGSKDDLINQLENYFNIKDKNII